MWADFSATTRTKFARPTRRAGAKQQDESRAEHTITNSAFAPALEHGNHSNKKQNDRTCGENFQHESVPFTSNRFFWNDARNDTAATLRPLQ